MRTGKQYEHPRGMTLVTRLQELQGTNSILECGFRSENAHRTVPAPPRVAKGGWLLEMEEHRTVPAPPRVAKGGRLLQREEHRTVPAPPQVAKGGWLLEREEHRTVLPIQLGRKYLWCV